MMSYVHEACYLKELNRKAKLKVERKIGLGSIRQIVTKYLILTELVVSLSFR